MSQYAVDVIVPTWNNPEYLIPMVNSMIRIGCFARGDLRLIIVNNGKQPIKKDLGGRPHIEVIDCEDNLGWEGGLKKGLELSDAPFVVFQNDDTFIPQSSHGFYNTMLQKFNDPTIAAVAPTTTCAAGVQSIYHAGSPLTDLPVCWSIFFCVMIRREYLDAVGGIDDTLPGGDDFDLSWRFHKAGYGIMVTPYAFIIHEGFKTGERVKGSPTEDGGWNSLTFTDNVNKALIQKHGFKAFHYQRYNQVLPHRVDLDDKEGHLIATMIGKDEKVLELGCGDKRTVPQAFTVDVIKRDNVDMLGDVSKPLELPTKYDVIIARHIIEHVIDTIGLIELWKTYLEPNGRIIAALPNEELVKCIPLDPQHYHAQTTESFRKIMEACGFKEEKMFDPKNNVSFVGEYKLCA